MTPIHELRPRLVDGSPVRRMRAGLVGVILIIPVFLCSAITVSPIEVGTIAIRLIFAAIDLLGLLVLVGGSYYLLKQHLTRIRLGDRLEIGLAWLQGRFSTEFNSQEVGGYERRTFSDRNKGRLRLVLILSSSILLGIWALGSVLSLLGLYSIRYGTPSYSKVIEYRLIWTWMFIETGLLSLTGLLIIPLGWRILTSDGVITLWCQTFGRSRPARLRIFAQASELNALEAWLIEHGVRRQNGPP